MKKNLAILCFCLTFIAAYSQLNCTCGEFYIYNHNKDLIKKSNIRELQIIPGKSNFDKSYFIETFDENGNMVTSDLTSGPKQKGVKFLFLYDSLGYLVKEKKEVSDDSLDANFINKFENNQLVKVINENEKDTLVYEYEGNKIKKEKLILLKPKKDKIFSFSSKYTNFSSRPYNYTYSYDGNIVLVKNEELSTDNRLICSYDKNHFLIEKKTLSDHMESYTYHYYYKKGLVKKVTMTFKDRQTKKEQTDIFYYKYI